MQQREAMETDRAEAERTKTEARNVREAAQEAKRLTAASEGAALDAQLRATTRHIGNLTRNQLASLLIHFGQKAPAATKTLADHQGAFYQFMASRPDLPYSPTHAPQHVLADIADAPELLADVLVLVPVRVLQPE